MSPATEIRATEALARARNRIEDAAKALDAAASELLAAAGAVPGAREGLGELGRRASELRGDLDATVARPFDQAVFAIVLAGRPS